MLDARPLQTDSGFRGIGTYTRRLLAGLRSSHRQAGVFLTRGKPMPAEVTSSEVAAYIPSLGRAGPIADHMLVSAALRRSGAGLYHAIEWGQPMVTRVPVVVTVHDLTPFVLGLPEYRMSRLKHLVGLHLLSRASAVLAVSSNTARDAARLAGVDPRRITVTPLAPSSAFRPAAAAVIDAARERFGVAGDYVLAVAPFDTNKRAELLCATVAELRRTFDVRLVIAGHPSPRPELTLAAVARHGLEDATVHTGFVSTEELSALYSGAACLLVTSAYEGFGLPLLEAMACGCPVVAFDNSSIPETAGPAALLVPDGDAVAMASSAARLLSDEQERERRAAEGIAWAARFNWERTVRTTLGVYDQVLNGDS